MSTFLSGVKMDFSREKLSKNVFRSFLTLLDPEGVKFSNRFNSVKTSSSMPVSFPGFLHVFGVGNQNSG